MKRLLDLTVSLFGLIALLPYLLVICLIIKIDSKGPIFFRQERVGLNGELFMMWKFRTMIPEASSKGSAITGSGDDRITRFGRILRLTKVDELPNLINVLIGDMSLVGPRPEIPLFIEGLSDSEKVILSVKPGITGPTQLRYISEDEMLGPVNVDENYVESVLKDKIKSDLRYVNQRTFFRDITLIFTTFFAIGYKLLGRRTGVMQENDVTEARREMGSGD